MLGRLVGKGGNEGSTRENPTQGKHKQKLQEAARGSMVCGKGGGGVRRARGGIDTSKRLQNGENIKKIKEFHEYDGRDTDITIWAGREEKVLEVLRCVQAGERIDQTVAVSAWKTTVRHGNAEDDRNVRVVYQEPERSIKGGW